MKYGDDKKTRDLVARAIAKALKIDVAFSRVTPANRIALLAEDRIDLTIATMGHNTQRDGQARFIRPHYYQSESILLGPRATEVKDWRDIAGRTICVTIGNGSNAQIVSQGARLMLFEDAAALPDRLRDATCGLAAQDDSFFAFHFTDAAFSERFERKFGFAQVPWGMAVAKTGSDKLASALDLISQMFHRDGVFIDIARANRVADAFLAAQREVWNRAACNTAGGSKDSSCVLPPLSAALQATPFAAAHREQRLAGREGRRHKDVCGVADGVPVLVYTYAVRTQDPPRERRSVERPAPAASASAIPGPTCCRTAT